MRKIDDNHLVTTGDQTVLSIQDNQVQIPIPDETNRKVGNAIEAYSIQGNTTNSPVVAVFTKKDENKVKNQHPTTSKGDDPTPIVEIPDYTKPIGTAGQEQATSISVPEYTKPVGTVGQEQPPTVSVPEYTKPISTVGQEQPPTVSVPEYTKPIGTVGQEQPPTVSVPEYTKPIGTAGQEHTPTVSVPEYKLRVLKDENTGVEIIGGITDLEGISHISSRRVLAQELFSKTYDAYDIHLKNPTGQSLQPKGTVLVRLPISSAVENVYYLTPSKELQALDFTIRKGMAEFTTTHFSTYAVVYKASRLSNIPEQKTSGTDIHPLAIKDEDISSSPIPVQTENHSAKKHLPATGETSNPLMFLSGLSLILTATFLLKSRKDESN